MISLSTRRRIWSVALVLVVALAAATVPVAGCGVDEGYPFSYVVPPKPGTPAMRIQPIINRAYHPTDNAIVERNHWTWEQHVLLEQHYQGLEEVQEETTRSFADRRERLPSRHRGCQGRPLAAAFPALHEPRRRYIPEEEARLFEIKRVDAYLSQWEWRRTVDFMGKISLAGRRLYVGKSYRRQMVKIRFDPDHREMVCALADGTQIARLTMDEFSQDYILGTADDGESDAGV